MLYYTPLSGEAYTNMKVVKMCLFGAPCASSDVAKAALKGSEPASCGEQSTGYH